MQTQNMEIFPTLYNWEGGILFRHYGHRKLSTLERVFESSTTELQNEVRKVWFVSLFYKKCLKFLLRAPEFPD